jgi:putative transposase
MRIPAMKRSRFSEEQIIGILKEHQAGLSATELCHRHGISDATFYTWHKKYGGMRVSEPDLPPLTGPV